MKLDLEKFKGTLPYASEIFGVYTPFLGWKSKRLRHRFNSLQPKYLAPLEDLISKLIEIADVEFDSCEMNVTKLNPAWGLFLDFDFDEQSNLSLLSIIYNDIKNHISYKDNVDKDSKDKAISDLITADYIKNKLNSASLGYKTVYKYLCSQIVESIVKGNYNKYSNYLKERYKTKLALDSKLATVILLLIKDKQFDDIRTLFIKHNEYVIDIKKKGLIQNDLFSLNNNSLKLEKPLIGEVPKESMKDIVLSPIGIVHLFRQYFFEFSTFLGTPIEHVWLSPGSKVTLTEFHTRKTIEEKSISESIESTFESKTKKVLSDEISTAIKEENNQNINLGASVDVNQSWSGGGMNASVNFDMELTMNRSKEKTHTQLRKQSSEVASKIRKNYSTSYKYTEEIIDSSSKKFVLKNSTEKLINYELRRKMRQVGVQLQDIGSYLCWQGYVDNPGEELGLANLVFMASPADLDNIPREEEAEIPENIKLEHNVTIKFDPVILDPSATYEIRPDKTYKNGRELDDNGSDMYNANHFIHKTQIINLQPPKDNYELENVFLSSSNSNLCKISVLKNSSPEFKQGKVSINLDLINFKEMMEMLVIMKGTWVPNDVIKKKISDANEMSKEAYQNKKQKAVEEAIYEGVRERINLASNIKERKFEDLREEERIVVYRKLIGSLINNVKSNDYDLESNASERHIIAETINAIFDVNKMLYFVAPEWWVPQDRTNKSRPNGVKVSEQQSEWGSIDRPENYLITEESEPAKLGSSLGWLLQLDGDNMRNAFLNSPWVKTVIPIRPGKEIDAINWLAAIEGSEGLDAEDINNPGNTILKSLEELAEKIKSKHQEGKKVVRYNPDPDDINDDNKVLATPIDKVYEYGFYPLEGGFKAQTTEPYEVFDQWIEVLPTDQIAPVEVEYDPKTGMQI